MSFRINYFKIATAFKALLGVKERNKKGIMTKKKLLLNIFYVSDTA